ncbi:MAG: S-layer homology domain-containing protein [Acidimicrobiaceae bacterium]|nr:S-layer homology domain-containing protein [Acidimicrobiaceae bacterium]
MGDATGDMMFSDVSEMNALRAEINCLAYYGVTVGYGDGNFGPNDDVTRGQMVLFMERAAAAAGADAEAVVGDFAETGSDPVTRADMALLIARLLVAATTAESTPNVTNNDDGTFAVSTVTDAKDWDYFADARRSLNRVSDSAVSALYELGVAKGTGMGYFSPAASVSRAEMAAFITRALGHTSARPAGVSIQSHEPGEVIVSVRDANFQPLANAVVDVFSVSDTRIDEAFNADGSCNTPRLRGEGDTSPCEIGATDAVTGLSGDYSPGTIDNVQPGGRTVFAWTGEQGDKVENGAEGLASISLTEVAPVTAVNAKVTNDLGTNTRAHFGSTVTVTIQLVGSADDNRADAGPDGDVNYQVITRLVSETDVATSAAVPTVAVDDTNTATKTTQMLKVDASGKATFTLTASDPDATDRNNPPGDSTADPVVPDKTDRVHIAYAVTPATGGLPLATDITGSSGTGTITFSDERGVFTAASAKAAAEYLAAPRSGSTSNVITVTVVDQFGRPVRGHEVILTGSDDSTFPEKARRTDSSGTVRIGYSYAGTTGVIETVTARTHAPAVTDPTTLVAITGGTATVYWYTTPTVPAGQTTVAVDAAILRVANVESNSVVIAADAAVPQLLVYDDNDQFVIGTGNVTMAAFEEQLAKEDGDDPDNNTVGVAGYDPNDPTKVARFTYTVVGDS